MHWDSSHGLICPRQTNLQTQFCSGKARPSLARHYVTGSRWHGLSTYRVPAWRISEVPKCRQLHANCVKNISRLWQCHHTALMSPLWPYVISPWSNDTVIAANAHDHNTGWRPRQLIYLLCIDSVANVDRLRSCPKESLCANHVNVSYHSSCRATHWQFFHSGVG